MLKRLNFQYIFIKLLIVHKFNQFSKKLLKKQSK